MYTYQWDRFRIRAILKPANSRYRRSKHDQWQMQERVFYFQRETPKSQLNSDAMPRYRHVGAPQLLRFGYDAATSTRHSPSQPLRPWSRSLCSWTSDSAWELPTHPAKSAMAAGVLSRSPMRPTLEAANTAMLTRTALSSSAWVETCGGAAMSATATTTKTTASHSSTIWKGLSIPNLLMFQVGNYWNR